MAKEITSHKDILGQLVSLDNYVAVSHYNSLYVCKVIKITKKLIRVLPIGKGYANSNGWLKHTSECVILSGPDVMVYIIKHLGA